MFRFIPNDNQGMPQRRAGQVRACEMCRRRKVCQKQQVSSRREALTDNIRRSVAAIRTILQVFLTPQGCSEEVAARSGLGL